MFNKTKIVATIGPASDNYDTIKKLILNGVNVVRANFSHGSGEDHKHKFDIAKQISKELNISIATLLDTKGPEIRIGKVENNIVKIEKNQTLELLCDANVYADYVGNSQRVCVSYEMHKDLKIGDEVLLDDGKLKTVVQNIIDNVVYVKTFNGHNLKTNKRINIPGIEFSLPFLSKKDKQDILFGISYGVDIIAASFVNSKENLIELREFLKNNGGENIRVCSKIESVSGVKNIVDIINYSDSIMIARGDLGLEIPYYNVPDIQKFIIKECNKLNKEVIVATQMLDSMEKSPLPTRAEVTDVYWANELGTDATMLSGETASGNFPDRSVFIMNEINKKAQSDFIQDTISYRYYIDKLFFESNPKEYYAYDLAQKTHDEKIEYIFVYTENPENLKIISKYRPYSKIIAIFDKKSKNNSIALIHNVTSLYDNEEEFNNFSKTHQPSQKILDQFNIDDSVKFKALKI
ncbi:pyruvate kinase [Mycoplasma phocoenae]|uniref:Pyruvate kinase n=1 Tax=Mycoplasma phocoenae TaxID=754517 RepID=A0A858U885_9MOLU|nr:pyruvate kinase [Mycoplasma phocoenae]QJG66968.1 pyruvate kinase [Mycoplasma phocoenae]